MSVLSAEGDGTVTAADGTAAASLVSTIALNNVSGTEPIELDVTQLVRDTLAAGKTRLTLKLALNAPSAVPLSVLSMIPNPAFEATVSNTGLAVTTARQDGVLADLYGANGEVLQQGVPIVGSARGGLRQLLPAHLQSVRCGADRARAVRAAGERAVARVLATL